MFLENFINSTYLNLIYTNYDEHYLELFEIDDIYVEQALLDFEEILGTDYVKQIGKI